jgi:hypothetical protein
MDTITTIPDLLKSSGSALPAMVELTPNTRRLISAAPEMYDALAPFAEFARVYLAQGPGGNRPTEGAIYSISFAGGDAEITVEALQRALAAIAKATGA